MTIKLFRQAARTVDVQDTGMKEIERRLETSSGKSNGKDSEAWNKRIMILKE